MQFINLRKSSLSIFASALFAVQVILPPAVSAQTCRKIRLGVVGEFETLTARTSTRFGRQIQEGVNSAIEVLKKQKSSICFESHKVDSLGNLANIAPLIQREISAGTQLFVGLGSSESVEAALPVFKENRAALCTPTASKSDLKVLQNNVIQVFPMNQGIAVAIAEHIAKSSSIKSIAVIYSEQDPYSKDLASHLRQELSRSRFTVSPIHVISGSIDRATFESQFKASTFDAVVIPLFEMDSAQILGHLALMRWNGVVYGSDAWGQDSKILRGATQVFKQVFSPQVYNEETGTSANRDFISNLSGTEEKPTELQAFTFDCTMLLARIIETCREQAVGQLNNCLKRSLPFQSTTGPLAELDGNALVRKAALKQW